MSRPGRWTLSTVALCLLSMLAAVPPADAGSQSFTSPGSFPLTVPVGVTSLHVVAVGASGAASSFGSSDGGHGAEVSGDLAVVPGQALFVDVGAVDGADAGRGGGGSTASAGGGGGASDVRITPGDMNARVIVAGGGGGGGGGGGAAGGDAGASGADLDGGGVGGGAGGAGSGGTGGAGDGGGTGGAAGAFGAGGSGGGSPSTDIAGAGGGGGGWFGGGGGGGHGGNGGFSSGGGGGGSNYAGAGVTNFSQHLAASFGNGSVLLSWTPSNEFGIGKLKRNLRKGTAKLTVKVPGPGTLALTGKGLVSQRPAGTAVRSRAVTAAGKVRLLIKAKGGKRRKLDRTGKVKVKASITYAPTGGTANTDSKRFKLKERP